MTAMRVSVVGPGVYLTGRVEGPDNLTELATALRPYEWMVVASPLVSDVELPPAAQCGLCNSMIAKGRMAEHFARDHGEPHAFRGAGSACAWCDQVRSEAVHRTGMASDPLNRGHGHVRPRPDGFRARCGGPALCSVCQYEAGTDMRSIFHPYQGRSDRVCDVCGLADRERVHNMAEGESDADV